MTVELAQGHGAVKAGQEGHLVVKLPYNDNGATIVRAWIGTEDRTLSFVGKGEYAPSHDDYDIHAMAPDPLPENTMWWIEIEKPDGAKVSRLGRAHHGVMQSGEPAARHHDRRPRPASHGAHDAALPVVRIDLQHPLRTAREH